MSPATRLPGVVQLLRLPQTESTQTVARFLAAEGAPAGTLVWADRQTAGRGRLERTWDSASGGLYFSLVTRPKLEPDRLADLGLETAGVVADALARLTGLETRVKKPNDVLAFKNGRGGKVSGILIEASGGERALDWVVTGIGVNVNNDVELETATTLRRLTGKRWPVDAVLKRILAGLNSL